jgi:hypothetical protein
MKWIEENVPLTGRLELSSWRTQALSTWNSVSDASVPAIVEVNAEPMIRFLEAHNQREGARASPVHFVLKAVALTLRELPNANCLIRNGCLYHRRDADIFIPVTLDTDGHELSYFVVRNADTKSVSEIAEELTRAAWTLRKEGTRIKTVTNRWLRRPFMRFVEYVLFSLNIWSPAMGIPKNPFGSAAVTDLSEFGADYMFPPLLPFARFPFVVGIGSIRSKYGPDGVAERWMPLCIVFDHRIIDGVYAGRIYKFLRRVWAAPEDHMNATDAGPN